MAQQKYLYGIKSIKFGTVVATGDAPAMPASGAMTSWAQTVQGSLTISEEESTVKYFYVEETTTAVHSIVTDAGNLQITWRAYDCTPALIYVVKGGISSTGDTGYLSYSGPDSIAAKELALEITTTNNVVFEVYRASCLARFDSVVGRENMLEMEVTATALAPETTGTDDGDQAPYKIKLPTS